MNIHKDTLHHRALQKKDANAVTIKDVTLKDSQRDCIIFLIIFIGILC